MERLCPSSSSFFWEEGVKLPQVFFTRAPCFERKGDLVIKALTGAQSRVLGSIN